MLQCLRHKFSFSSSGYCFCTSDLIYFCFSAQAYVMDHVINSNDEDQDVETATDEEALVMAEKLNDSRILLAGFLKLTMFNVVDAKMAAPIWGHFISVRELLQPFIRILSIVSLGRGIDTLRWFTIYT